ncbi:MAG: hypothetical protein KAH44_14465, partial [Oricola sp.]|nr:hypothetical protein [Oricola sp.]
MENTQFSILTALFGGKPANGAQGGAGLFAAPAEDAESQGQGFFSFIEGLLTPRPDAEREGELQPAGDAPFMAPAFAASRNMKMLETETKAGETLGVAMIPM